MTGAGVRTTAYILLFAIGFLITSSIATALLRRSGIDDLDIVSARIGSARNDEDTNLLFIGTSRLIEGVNPEVFDDTAKERGLTVRSFNFGLPGVNVVELLVLARRYLQTRPCCIKYAIVEPDFAFLDVIKSPNNPRAIRFASLDNAWDLYRYLSSMQQKEISAAEYSANLLIATARHYSNIGAVRMLADRSLTNYSRQPMQRGFIGERGSLAATIARDPKIADAYADTVKFLDDFNDLGAITAESSARQQHEAKFIRALVSQYQFERLGALINLLHDHGIAILLLRTPQISHVAYNISFTARYRKDCTLGPPILDLGRPHDYPALFDPKNRTDSDHMNVEGSTILTKLLAEQFAGLLRTKQQAMKAPLVCRVQ